MSLDAGGLAQMTYNNNFNNGGLGMPGAGFASRGKGAQLKRLSLASPPKVASISENQESVPTPRTSRSHLLAGLRTAPKTPTGVVPASAPYNQSQHRFGGLDTSRHADNGKSYGNAIPQTATGASFGNAYGQYNMINQQQSYAMPEHVLAPPPLQYNQDEQMDPNILAQLMATELFLEERRKQLQRQLLSLTNQQLGFNDDAAYAQQFSNNAASPSLNYLGQQQQYMNMSAQQDNQGQYVVYNPMTGNYQYVMDPRIQSQLASSPPPPTPSFTSSPPKAGTPTFRAEVTPPDEKVNPFGRASSPPKKSPSPPTDVQPLPPPSANAFRRGHRKGVSSLALNNSTDVSEGPRSAFTRPVGFPQTPVTGTFGPGQGRAGEHPVRQPRGPPSFDELKAAPTAKHEGSKNFATRQRRHAVKNLVRAGIERRGVRSGSGGSMTPVSEPELSYDSDSARSGSLSGKPSIGSLRAAVNGAIGSERKELARNRSSVDNFCSANSVSSDEGVQVGGKLVEVRVQESQNTGERRNMPRLVLNSAEKRKSTMF